MHKTNLMRGVKAYRQSNIWHALKCSIRTWALNNNLSWFCSHVGADKLPATVLSTRRSGQVGSHGLSISQRRPTTNWMP
jgi:hypothetical protein